MELDESVWQRARKDTLSAFHTLRFWLFGLFAGALLTIFVLFWTPPWVKDSWKIVYQISVPLLGVVSGLGILVLSFLIVAPYRQRNELRKKIIELESKLEDKKQRAQLRTELGVLVIEGTEVLKGFKSVRTFSDDMPTEEFKIWREKGAEIFLRHKLNTEYSLWFRDVYINIADSLLPDYIKACEAGLNRLEGILNTLSD